jgi:hypothetical protein
MGRFDLRGEKIRRDYERDIEVERTVEEEEDLVTTNGGRKDLWTEWM